MNMDMKINKAMEYCLSKKGAEEAYPFDMVTIVFKLGGKMFGLVYDRDGEIGLNLKCDSELSLALRQQYEGIIPGYHMNKKHWNTVIFEKDVPDEEIYRLIDLSYDIVYKSLSKKVRDEIEKNL
jgi:predicted DNA-binding protein (MmcQ/YjbR family)